MTLPTSEKPDTPIDRIIHRYRPSLEPFESIYKDFHQHPELSTQETRTAAIAAKHVKDLGFAVEEYIGGTGVAGVFKNGPGPVVLLRAEMDALPILEKTNLPYASSVRMTDTDGKEKLVSHACGHDMHVTCLMAASTLLHDARQSWSGTLICLFQPGEEHGGGARAMLEDGLYDRHGVPIPDVVLGQHVVNIRAGVVATRAGYSLAGKNVFEFTIYGRGGHGSMPQDCIDPVVIACYTVVRLQSVVSRELDPNSMALITCGCIQAGDAPNAIPDEAVLKVDIRAYSPNVLTKAVHAFKRIVAAECQASGVSKEASIKEIENVPPLVNSPKIVEALRRSVPYAYWNVGSTDHKTWEDARKEGRLNELPGNHSAL